MRHDSGFELPDELAIDTTAARRIIGAFIRAQLDQAGFAKVLLGLSGGSIRPWSPGWRQRPSGRRMCWPS